MNTMFRLMRLHQPTGVWLLLFPCWWSIALASGGTPPFRLLVLFFIGAVVMRAAGCIINDIADREFDARVERTRNRPLASGAVTVRQAVLLLCLLLAIALVIALMIMQKSVLILAIISLPFVAAYPWMKRITWYPQAFLGMTFNFGALMGWAAVRDTIEWPALLLYLGGIFWTLGYDTVYAHQDKLDDQKIGVKSTALRWGDDSKYWIAGFYGMALTCWAVAGHGGYYYLLLALITAHFFWQVTMVNLADPGQCGGIFRSNAVVGLLLFIGTILSSYS